MKNTKHLIIQFSHAIPGYDWHNILDIYKTSKNISNVSFMINRMEDTLYKEIQLTESLTKNQLIFLVGLCKGYLRNELLFMFVDSYGDKSSYWYQGDL